MNAATTDREANHPFYPMQDQMDAYDAGRAASNREAELAIRRMFRPDGGRRNGTYNDGLRDALWALARIRDV